MSPAPTHTPTSLECPECEGVIFGTLETMAVHREGGCPGTPPKRPAFDQAELARRRAHQLKLAEAQRVNPFQWCFALLLTLACALWLLDQYGLLR